MKKPRSGGLLSIAFSLLAFSAPIAFAADGPPTIMNPPGDAPCTVTDNGNTFTLDNGIVRATIDKRTGDFLELFYKGVDRLGHDQGRVGCWEQDPSAAAKVGGLTQSITIDPKTNGGARAEVSIKGVTKGDPTAGLTPSSPGQGAQGTVNLDLEIRWGIGRGESGVYTYAIFSHPEAYGPLNVPESRFITRVNQSFDWISVDADRNMLQCAPTDWGTGVVVHAKEQRIMSKGVYKNSVEHKYSYNAVQYKIPAYGWSSTSEKVGVWFINPTIEYLSGGASKQELVCHFGDNGNPDPILLNYWRGTHYGGGASASIAAGEKWEKVIGPMMVYVNSLENSRPTTQAELATLKATEGNPTVPQSWTENQTALWQDALAQAKKEKQKWPYDWVQGVDYAHKNERGGVSGQIALNDPQASSTRLPHLTVGLAHPFPGDATTGPRITVASVADVDEPAPGGRGAAPGRGARGGRGGRGGFGGFGGGRTQDWAHDAKYYQFWNDGAEDGKFTITDVIPGTYTLHAFADGVLGELMKADITVEAGKTVDLGTIEWKPERLGKQIWEIGYPTRAGDKFFKGDGQNYWLWGWGLRYALLFPKDIVYTIGKSDYHKDWMFQQTPRATSMAFINPAAKDPANQRFGWVKAESLEEYPQTNTQGPWRIYGRGEATTWTIKFNMDNAPKGQAALRIALAGADGGGLNIGVNGKQAGAIRPVGTNSLRYNTNKSVWYQYALTFDAGMMKQGENEITLTVPAGELTSGVTYDYLRLEIDENARPPVAAAQ
jgi:rhamnogalacturonan endolyase